MAIRVILIGPPGVGKGTQAALLEGRFDAKPISSGKIFRAEIEAETDLGRLARSYIERGELVPNGITIEMISKRLRTSEVLHRGFVLDGFPRTIRQAEALTHILEELDLKLDKVVSIEVDEEVVVRRLSGRLGCTMCGEIYNNQNKPPMREGLCDKCNGPLMVRSDDQPQTIRERLRVFKENTAPLIEYYEKQGCLLRVDGSREPSAIFQDIADFDPL